MYIVNFYCSPAKKNSSDPHFLGLAMPLKIIPLIQTHTKKKQKCTTMSTEIHFKIKSLQLKYYYYL